MLISPCHTIGMIVDIQEKLLPHIRNHEKLIQNITILLKGLNILEIPYILNEQYPKGLGSTVKEVAEHLEDINPFEKTSFSCCGNEATHQHLLKAKKSSAIVFGIETHVCVMQTCLDLLANNIAPIIVTDCVGSRKQKDHEVAMMRLVQAGVIPATYESLLFELCKDAQNQAFKEISKLVK